MPDLNGDGRAARSPAGDRAQRRAATGRDRPGGWGDARPAGGGGDPAPVVGLSPRTLRARPPAWADQGAAQGVT